jgi:iron transport multicopper oxidase
VFRAGFNNVTYLLQKVPSLFTAMTVGAAAENPVVYGVNGNAFVVKGGQLVEIVINNYDTGGHPIHLHGHAPQLVARAPGVYTPPSPEGQRQYSGHANPQANAMGYDGDTSKMPRIPMRRDTWIVAAAGYTVLRFIADNPGVWFLHCHMEWHLEAGLAAMIIEDPLSLQRNQKIPDAWKTQCQNQGIAISGNAAGNTKNYTDLTGANTVCPPLPWS